MAFVSSEHTFSCTFAGSTLISFTTIQFTWLKWKEKKRKQCYCIETLHQYCLLVLGNFRKIPFSERRGPPRRKRPGPPNLRPCPCPCPIKEFHENRLNIFYQMNINSSIRFWFRMIVTYLPVLVLVPVLWNGGYVVFYLHLLHHHHSRFLLFKYEYPFYDRSLN